MIYLHWKMIDKQLYISSGMELLGYAFLDKEHPDQYFDLLSDQEQARAERLQNPMAANQQIISRGILRLVLSQIFDIRPQTLQFGLSPHNKPFLTYPAETGVHFNIAHSGHLLCMAISNKNRVGIDVERFDPNRDFSVITPMVFSLNEQTSLSQSLDPIQDFYTLWTAKEAVLKAAGCGFSFPPHHLHLELVNGNVSLSRLPAELAHNGRCTLTTFTPTQGYTAAFASLTQQTIKI